MLSSEKISAYGAASRFVNSFSVGDYVLYYAKGIGVVAIGEIISDVSNVVEDGNSKELYRMVKLLVTNDIPVHENELRAISVNN